MTPTEQQLATVEYSRSKPLTGLDAAANNLLGRWRRRGGVRWRLNATGRAIHSLRLGLRSMNDGELNAALHTMQRERRARPGAWREQLVRGLALLAVVAERELGLSAYEQQLMAAAALVEGFFAEMDTGEGKTLSIGLAAAFTAWNGLPCHVITANDYLAERDAINLSKFYRRAGLSAGSVQGEDAEPERREGYAQSVTYTTAKEAAADYLRDDLCRANATGPAHRLAERLGGEAVQVGQVGGVVQRGLAAAFVDEADHALIDEAVTPLIISHTRGGGDLEVGARAAWALVSQLVPEEHYRIDRQRRTIEIMRPGLALILESLALPQQGLWGGRRRRIDLVRLAIEAREFFHLDDQYVVQEGKVVIVDPATGRPMPMRTWRAGLHQVIEAKEGVAITGEMETLARISFQSFFRRYRHLSGASGTLAEAASELWATYAVPFVKVPRHLPSQLRRVGTVFLPDAASQQAALLHEVRTRRGRKQPLLIGTRSVDTSEQIHNALADNNLHNTQVLNARRLKEESSLVAAAGRESQITIATSMAGRGTDIRLGDGVAILGGLHVIAVEANESSRVDRQLFGRAARQGDPGSVMSILQADDAVLQRFIPGGLRRAWAKTLRNPLLRPLGQLTGHLLLRWARYRAGIIAAKSRRNVMESEKELARSLGFTTSSGRSAS
jgi:preprotein translocase subunit SecA